MSDKLNYSNLVKDVSFLDFFHGLDTLTANEWILRAIVAFLGIP